jgi:hypothetical protein
LGTIERLFTQIGLGTKSYGDGEKILINPLPYHRRKITSVQKKVESMESSKRKK